MKTSLRQTHLTFEKLHFLFQTSGPLKESFTITDERLFPLSKVRFGPFNDENYKEINFCTAISS